MIDRYLLRYFLAVADEGNFSLAAAHCNVTQPTLSVGIAKLERELGTALFLRSSRRVQLTPAGSRFLVHARRIETEFNVALQEMATTADSRVLRLGVLLSIPGDRIADAVRTSAASAEPIPVEVIYGRERELIGLLARGRLDIALTLVARGSDRFLEQPLLTEGYRLALPRDHPLADHEQIAAEALADNVMIVRRHCEALVETSRHFTERGVRPRFALRSTNDERVLQMVAAGLGVTVMPELYRHSGVARPKLTGFGVKRSLGFAFSHDAEHFSADQPQLLAALGLVLRDKSFGPTSS